MVSQSLKFGPKWQFLYFKSKKKGKDQESIQLSTTPNPGYQRKSDNFTFRHHKREPRGQPFPACDHKASINIRTRKHNKRSTALKRSVNIFYWRA